MSRDGISLQFTEDGFAILQMNNGQNRFNTPFLKSLNSALDDILKNSSCKALITTSTGHAFAGGAFFAMVHDYRVMRDDKGWICWNETHIKMRFPENLLEILRLKVPRCDALREAVIFGRRITAQEARQLDLIDVVAELSNLIPEAKKLATSALGKTGIDRNMLSVMKQDIYSRTVKSNL
ncbi:hypothetical protein KUTeg_019776 [Tegillarca granosa]|uniref:Uncharacterized protein n=1 Tax=Tegillarca granosa TaxID=220873 RepID=A0ABQ9EE03_TEGGR|nr:hypothetical protein KUTeg_019776 [Tegillarca granosa]